MEAITTYLASFFPFSSSSASKAVFTSAVPRSEGIEDFVNLLVSIKIEVEPKLQYYERECFKVGPPVGGADALETNELIKTLFGDSIEKGAEWALTISVIGDEYQKTYGPFDKKEKKIFDEQLKIAGTFTCDFDAWFSAGGQRWATDLLRDGIAAASADLSFPPVKEIE